jgi:hypothetical protein
MEYPDPIWQRTISSLDLSGSPSLAMGPNDSVYWVVSSRGTFGSVATSRLTIVVGAHDKEGNLLWVLQDARLTSTATDTQPQLTVGEEGELYVVYTTTGSTPGNTNMQNVFSLCGGCSLLKGPEDIVIARLDPQATGPPTVVWVKQDSTLNSCARETSPSIVFNTVSNQLLVAYQTTGATLCEARVGSPNIVLTAFTPAGGLAWATQNNLFNSRGQNGTPSVTYDASGCVYMAYTITSPVEGGTFQGVKDIEVVKCHPEGSPVRIVRDWILSATYILSTPLADTDPVIVCDRERGILYVAFATNGTISGGTHTSATTDLALVAFSTDGTHLWSFQSPSINEPTYQYVSVDHPVIALDSVGNVYVATHARRTDGNSMLLVLRFQPGSPATSWLVRCGYRTYRAYIPVGLQGAPRALVFTTGDVYSPPALTIQEGNLYLGFHTFASTDAFSLTALRQQYPYEDMSAFEYMTDFVGPCKNCVD